MDRRAFLKFLPRSGVALATAAAGVALPAAGASALICSDSRLMEDKSPPHGRVLGLRATVDPEDQAYNTIDNCWRNVKEVWFNGKKVDEGVITANERTGYIRCYVFERTGPHQLVVKERYNLLTGVMVDDTFEAWGDVRIVLNPARHQRA